MLAILAVAVVLVVVVMVILMMMMLQMTGVALWSVSVLELGGDRVFEESDQSERLEGEEEEDEGKDVQSD